MNRLAARLTKRGPWRKASFGLLLFPLTVTAAPGPSSSASADELRDCIAAARDTAAISACETQQQRNLKDRVERLSAAIRARLDTRQRLVFERSTSAWQTFVGQEEALLKLTLGLRGDGLGPSLGPGAKTLLYEQRERQLREHLHNLKSARTKAIGTGR